jgi:hypothetical protein
MKMRNVNVFANATKITIVAFVLACTLIVPAPAQAQWSNMSLTLFDQPCRSVDTRLITGFNRPLQDNEIYIFSVDPLFSILQGGVTNCGVPSNAVAVKLWVKGQSITFDGGYFRVFRAGGSVVGPYSTLQLQDPGQFVSGEFDIPIDGNMEVAIHTLKSAHAVVDIAGYYTSTPLTGMISGEVTDKHTAAGMPPAVELTLDNGAKVVCTLPDSDHLNCDAASIGQSVVASGKVVNAGEQVIYAVGAVYVN